MKNQEIRQVCKQKGIFQYQVADALGVTEMTFIRWLRKPLPDKKRIEILNAISRLAAEQTEA